MNEILLGIVIGAALVLSVTTAFVAWMASNSKPSELPEEMPEDWEA